ncbi:MAG: hypothetical protein OEZ10_13245 [Gammaproteobacteria bacterium]|nr:hypothetical protein [Gammaproteobacteria bacterium]
MITETTVRPCPAIQGGSALFVGLNDLLGPGEKQNRLLLELRGSSAAFTVEMNETFRHSHELFMRKLQQNEPDKESLSNPLLYPSCLLADFVPELVQLFLALYSSLDSAQRQSLGQYLSVNGGIHALLGWAPASILDSDTRVPGRVLR